MIMKLRMGAILNCWTSLLLAALLLCSLLFGSSGCGPAIRMVTEEPRPLLFVGSVSFGEMTRVDDSIHIPITMGEGPWQRNSGQFPTRVITNVRDRKIDMTICFSSSQGHVEHGRRLVLSEDLTGDYEIFYLDPNGTRHPLGKLTF